MDIYNIIRSYLHEQFLRRSLATMRVEFDINRNFLRNITESYIIPFEAYMQQCDLSWDDFKLTLNIHRGTVSRWIKREIQPELTTIFQFLAARGQNVAAVEFPNGRDAVLDGIARTLVDISRETQRVPVRPIDRRCVELLRFLSSHPSFRLLIVPTRRDAAMMEMLCEFNQQQTGSHLTVTCIESTLADWFIPWVLFRYAVFYPWAS